MTLDRHKVDGLKTAVRGFIIFNKFGDVWMGGHDKDRLREFVRQHPQLKLEPEIYTVSTRIGDVRIHRPDCLHDKHIEKLAKIPSPIKQGHKKRNLLPASALRRKD